MHILYLNARYLPEGIGGPAHSTRFIAEQVVREGHRATVFCRASQSGISREQMAGVEVIRVGLDVPLLQTVGLFVQALDANKPDVIHALFPREFPLNMLAQSAHKRGIPIVQTLLSFNLMCQNSFVREGRNCTRQCAACRRDTEVERAYCGQVAAAVGISRYMLELHEREGLFMDTPVKAVIPQAYEPPLAVRAALPLPASPTSGGGATIEATGGGGATIEATSGGGATIEATSGGGATIEATGGGGASTMNAPSPLVGRAGEGRLLGTPAISANQPDTSIAPRTLRLGYLGRLDPLKGIDRLLDALTGTALKNREWSLQIAGTGAPDYEQSLKAKYPDPRIQYLGFVQPDELLANIDVLVAPALWQEPLGRIVLEAYAHGVPVIASRRGGMLETVEAGVTGYLFEPAQRSTLVDAIRQCMDAPERVKTMGKNALEKWRQTYTPAVVAKQYLDVYSAVLEQK